MRRGPAALLSGPLAATAYFALAPVLPALPRGDAAALVAGAAGMLAVAAATLWLAPVHAHIWAGTLIVLGAGIMAGGLSAAGVGTQANVPEALAAGALGVLFARALDEPAVVVAVPLFVAGVDVWSVLGGPSERLLAGPTEPVDLLSLDLPAWGGSGSAGRVGFPDAVFLTTFAAWTWRLGLRRRATVAGLVAGLFGALVLGVVLDRGIPVLPFLAAGFLLVNADRLGRLLRGRSGGCP